MTALVFVDTNIFVYARDPRDPVKRARAREWLELLWREQRGRTSIQVLNEYYAVAHRRSRSTGVIPRSRLGRRPRACSSGTRRRSTPKCSRAHTRSKSSYRLNWWDCLIVAAAQAQGCALLLTEDLQDGADYGGVIVRNPFKLGVAEERSGVRAVAAKLASRHRGRGRPRTQSPTEPPAA